MDAAKQLASLEVQDIRQELDRVSDQLCQGHVLLAEQLLHKLVSKVYELQKTVAKASKASRALKSNGILIVAPDEEQMTSDPATEPTLYGEPALEKVSRDEKPFQPDEDDRTY